MNRIPRYRVVHDDHAVPRSLLDYAAWRLRVDLRNVKEGVTVAFNVPTPNHETLMTPIYGPCMGDPVVVDAQCYYAPRPPRTYRSRMIAGLPQRPVNRMTYAGYRAGGLIVIRTVYGGPVLSPMEPGDPRCDDLVRSRRFWSEHALSDQKIGA